MSFDFLTNPNPKKVYLTLKTKIKTPDTKVYKIMLKESWKIIKIYLFPRKFFVDAKSNQNKIKYNKKQQKLNEKDTKKGFFFVNEYHAHGKNLMNKKSLKWKPQSQEYKK